MRKLGLIVLTAAFCSFFAAALPGVDAYISDTSGEYVYFRDSSFKRESYVGFLYYNDGTYAARYYSPANLQEQQLEINVELLFSVDSTKNYVEMTGERFITTITQEDTDIVNYLHDLMYELTARRRKIGELSPASMEGIENEKAGFINQGLVVRDDYMQFGGSVTMLYDWLVPLFNLKSITSSSGEVMLEVVTAGALLSSEDKSFSNFEGIPEVLPVDGTAKKIEANSNTQEFILNRANAVQKISLDETWQQSMDNLWTLGDEAILILNIVPINQKEEIKNLHALLRKLLLGTEGSYTVWPKFNVSITDTKINVLGYYWQPSGTVLWDEKILTQMNQNEFGYLNMTVFDGIYRKNHSYFDNLLKSYKVNE